MLPLCAVLDELVHQTAYACNLVDLGGHGRGLGGRGHGSRHGGEHNDGGGDDNDNGNSNNIAATFRAVSFLDDYVHRPAALDPLGLYEFVAKHFRRRRAQCTAPHTRFLSDHPLADTH